MLRRKTDIWNGKERRSPASILVVNEEADACELLARFLGEAGYETVSAGTDADAMYQMIHHLPRCVVLDMQAGGVGSSLRILDQIRSYEDGRLSNARVVLCAQSPKNRTFSFQSGADAFVIRPFHLADLIAQIEDVLARPHDQRARHRRDELARQQ
jgi:DNA-binding response OmpR family regulator